jgi:hypothetical protein
MRGAVLHSVTRVSCNAQQHTAAAATASLCAHMQKLTHHALDAVWPASKEYSPADGLAAKGCCRCQVHHPMICLAVSALGG